MSFPAKFPGQCAQCDTCIEVGDEIKSGEDGYQHVDCPEFREKPTKFQGTTLEEMGF